MVTLGVVIVAGFWGWSLWYLRDRLQMQHCRELEAVNRSWNQAAAIKERLVEFHGVD